jgi:SH3-like domain-containing protein
MQKIIFISFILLFFYLDLASAEDKNFLTLRYDIVNLRQGPSKDYPIKIFYKKKFLPVQIKDSSDNFRKVKDHENNSGWIHISQLAKRKASSVQFIHFKFKEEQIKKFKDSSSKIIIGIDHVMYAHTVKLTENNVKALSLDFS